MPEANTNNVSASESSSRPPRTLVLCFDGTHGQYDSTNTNVVKFYGLLTKNRPHQQVAYYQAGIGTYFAPGVVSPLWTWLASLLDEAFAWYLDAHVMGGYKYLMDNYHTGDKICLFGFSRGAYTARALAGMLNKVGLLQKDNLQQVDFALKAYKQTDKEGVKLAAGFKKTFSQNVTVEFVGVWDTVQSTGVVINRVLPFTDSNASIKVFRHALSLDEHRARFLPNLYHWPTQVDAPDDVADAERKAAYKFRAFLSTLKNIFTGERTAAELQQATVSAPVSSGVEDTSDVMQPKTGFVAEESVTCTDVREVWFAGCHSDIGGGNVEDDVEVSLAQIPLHWMVEQVMESQCGILFDSDQLARIGFTTPPNSPQSSPDCKIYDPPHVAPDTEIARNAIETSGPVAQEPSSEPNQSTSSPEAYPERSDAIAPLFDELKLQKVWWLLEFIPTSYAWQDGNGGWHSKWRINLGKGRFIPFRNPKFHHTVKERMDYKPLNYKPRALYDHNEVYI